VRVKILHNRKRKFSPIAMADIAFLLLIFLILVTGIDEKGNVKLPVFRYSQKVSSPKRIAIVIDKSGRIFVDGFAMDWSRFDSFLNSLSNKKDIIARLIADSSTDYSNVDRVLSFLRKKNILKIVLVTKEPVNGKKK